jgi:5-methylcytosine-specific restriction protein A
MIYPSNHLQALGFKSYSEYLNNPIWKSKRDFYIKRHPFCEKCKKVNSVLVHHLHYNNVGNESGRDLMALCKKCHNKIHGIKDD